MSQESKLSKQAEASIPTDWGEFMMKAYSVSSENVMPHIVLTSKNLDTSGTIYLRIHSECITGDLFHSNRCDCGEQLEQSMKLIQENGGMVIYLRQEGRGIGIINKLKVYNKQDEGFDTIEANLELGFGVDMREFKEAISILKQEGVSSVRLLTNNPKKLDAFEGSGIELVERVPLETTIKKENEGYLKTKKEGLGHLFDSF